MQPLVELLGDPDPNTRADASRTLFAQGASAVTTLIDGMSHRDWRVRVACAGLMDHLGDDRCIPPLRQALQDPSPHVRRHAVHSLGCQDCKVTPLRTDVVGLLIGRALTDASIRVRRVAVHQLGLQPHDARAIEALQTILHEDTDTKLRSRAQFALQNHQGG